MTGAQPLLDPENGATEQGQRGHTTMRWVEVLGASGLLIGASQLVAFVHSQVGGNAGAVVLAAKESKERAIIETDTICRCTLDSRHWDLPFLAGLHPFNR
eukprot:Skav234739  [mRNA]  locus=scaffold14:79790:80887:+ [translate_table: standard]